MPIAKGQQVAHVRTGNRRLMREVNSKLVLGVIRGSQAISQVEILERTQLSAGTVANIVGELKERGFVREIGLGLSTTGRRPVLLEFNPQARYVLGIELTADQTRVALLDLAANITKKREHATVANSDPRAVLQGVCAEAASLVAEAGIAKERLLGAGIAIEGVVDQRQEHLVLLANLGWRNVAVKSIVEESLQVPAVVNNSGAAMVLGEYLYGAGREITNAVCLDVDSGIGAVAILNGRVLRGAHGMSGEIGHNMAVPDGELCSCGKRGCLETVASAGAILARLGKARRQGRDSSICQGIDGCPTPQAIRLACEAAEAGDALASEILREAGYHLGIAAAGLVNLLDPEMMILTGMVAYESRGLLLRMVREVASEHILEQASRSVRIEQGILGDNAAIIGAAASVYESAFRVPVEPDL